MKAFLLAAGEGSRLRPLTERTPKCLLPVGPPQPAKTGRSGDSGRGVPLLKIWLENCASAGIAEVLVNVHAHREQVKDFARQQDSGVKVRIAEEPALLGSAGTLAENKGFVAEEKEFYVLYGDVLTNANLGELLCFHRERDVAATIGIYQVPDPARCGIVSVDGRGLVHSFVEKPARPESNWAFSGLMVARPEILEMVPQNRPADIGFDLLPKLVGRMAAYKIEDFVLDIGTMENYMAAKSSWPGLRSANAQRNHF